LWDGPAPKGGRVIARPQWIAASAVLDGIALAAAYFVVLAIHNGTTLGGYLSRGTFTPNWSLCVMLVATVLCFAAVGLYDAEVHVFRPLLLRTLAKGVVAAFIASAITVYLVKSPQINQSRSLLLGTFGLFVLLSAFLRLSIQVRLYRRKVVAQRPIVLVVGQSARSEVLKSRLSDLCGFSRWKAIVCAGGVREYSLALNAALDGAAANGRLVQAVIIDAAGMALPDVLPVVQQVRARRCCEVYVLSELAWPVRPTRLLGDLFEAPVVRVRRRAPNGAERRVKRVLDVVLSSLGLAVCALPMGAIAVAIKLSSPGPLFCCQERIGLRGRGFRFVKFRSMVVGDHEQRHRQYVQALICGDTKGCDQGDQEGHIRVLKMTDDDRVTRVGRFLRRYSLDELPQLWNVLRGDMSLVGPRPPLPYEADAYTDWHRQRLQALPGVSGLWQVGGRSRVTFDEMVFQDLFYATNQSPLADLAICLRTVPAIINGRGAV
jgi:exopolysaccharide biosynthesis polyprenyl glycosylphosphotransferase